MVNDHRLTSSLEKHVELGLVMKLRVLGLHIFLKNDHKAAYLSATPAAKYFALAKLTRYNTTSISLQRASYDDLLAQEAGSMVLVKLFPPKSTN